MANDITDDCLSNCRWLSSTGPAVVGCRWRRKLARSSHNPPPRIDWYPMTNKTFRARFPRSSNSMLLLVGRRFARWLGFVGLPCVARAFHWNCCRQQASEFLPQPATFSCWCTSMPSSTLSWSSGTASTSAYQRARCSSCLRCWSIPFSCLSKITFLYHTTRRVCLSSSKTILMLSSRRSPAFIRFSVPKKMNQDTWQRTRRTWVGRRSRRRNRPCSNESETAFWQQVRAQRTKKNA